MRKFTKFYATAKVLSKIINIYYLAFPIKKPKLSKLSYKICKVHRDAFNF